MYVNKDISPVDKIRAWDYEVKRSISGIALGQEIHLGRNKGFEALVKLESYKVQDKVFKRLVICTDKIQKLGYEIVEKRDKEV